MALKTEHVISSWDVLIQGGEGKSEGVLADIERFLEESKAPKIKWKRQNVAPGTMQSLFGGKRPFLIITNHASPNIKQCKLYISVRDYGVNLQVTWYLVQQLTLWQQFVTLMLKIPVVGLLLLPAYAAAKHTLSKEAGTLGLNLFDEQDLSAFCTNAHHCIVDAVDKLTKDHQLDLPKMDRTSKGFLNVT